MKEVHETTVLPFSRGEGGRQSFTTNLQGTLTRRIGQTAPRDTRSDRHTPAYDRWRGENVAGPLPFPSKWRGIGEGLRQGWRSASTGTQNEQTGYFSGRILGSSLMT